ncbi:MAG: prephenate dehydrogenase/arogenate dehydrogenase family protein [Clostridia bacterium]|nr:prephenate dehydrogenase/arogenate dehydrogenase family protein [Clostridia bacterium]
MKICVAGLGLIGGSMCMALKRAGYNVDGYNRSAAPLDYALKHGIIDNSAKSFEGYDVVFVALPPKPTVDFIVNTPFKNGAIVADICGVKKYVQDAVQAARTDIKYVGTHPMAGKEVSGVENACADLFDRASMVITPHICTDEHALGVIKQLVKDMGFARIVECSAEIHDKKIAYTSQLAHVVSNCYVNDPEIDGCLGFTGGSFQDMTRIAGVDEGVWSELYLKNADNLLTSVTNLSNSLNQFIAALQEAKSSGNSGVIKDNLAVGAKAYRNGKANNFTGEGITVTELK